MVDILDMPKVKNIGYQKNFFKDLTDTVLDKAEKMLYPFPKLYTVKEVMEQKGKIFNEK